MVSNKYAFGNIEENEYLINGVKVSATNQESALEFIIKFHFKSSGYICIFGLNILVRAFQNQKLRIALNNSILNPVHGKSIELFLKRKGFKNCKTVDGNYLLEHLLNSNLTHYFYGTNDSTLKKIKYKIENNFSNAKILGYKAPPLVDINEIETNSILNFEMKQIATLKPDIVWVGLGGIKQDMVMYHYHQYFSGTLMIGVGAVFDYFAENLKLSSSKIKDSGFRWLHRLLRQPILLKKTLSTIGLLIFFSFISIFRKSD